VLSVINVETMEHAGEMILYCGQMNMFLLVHAVNPAVVHKMPNEAILLANEIEQFRATK
jgi:hypothetical protein